MHGCHTFYDFQQSVLQVKNREIFIFVPLIFGTWDLTDDQASIYDRKTAAQRFDTTHDILRSLNLVLN